MEPFLGQIMLVPYNFAPRGWAFCDGQLLPIAQNTALFSLLGTTFGGDGRTTFGLPDLRGRVAIGEGTGAGLTPQRLGERSGAETHTLSVSQIPSHNHAVSIPVSEDDADQGEAAGKFLANGTFYHNDIGDNVHYGNGPIATSFTGAGNPVTNMQPTLCLHYIIALVGVFPSRS